MLVKTCPSACSARERCRARQSLSLFDVFWVPGCCCCYCCCCWDCACCCCCLTRSAAWSCCWLPSTPFSKTRAPVVSACAGARLPHACGTNSYEQPHATLNTHAGCPSLTAAHTHSLQVDRPCSPGYQPSSRQVCGGRWGGHLLSDLTLLHALLASLAQSLRRSPCKSQGKSRGSNWCVMSCSFVFHACTEAGLRHFFPPQHGRCNSSHMARFCLKTLNLRWH